jgi:ferric-dicitrate binding protein FerR (iron transport regulator)
MTGDGASGFRGLDVTGISAQADALAQMVRPASHPLSDDEHREIAADQLRAAEIANERIAALLELTDRNVALTEQAQAAADRTERFSRRIAWASLAISVASLIAAVLAVVLQAVAAGASPN